MHGIKITGPNPSVTQFHQTIDDDPERRKSQNKNCRYRVLINGVELSRREKSESF